MNGPAVLETLLRKVSWPSVLTACWPWVGSINSEGYGRLRGGEMRDRQAHRVMYELVIAPVPDELVLDHLCRVRHCVNPLHLEPVPERINILRGKGFGAINAEKTHCSNGHEFNDKNTYAWRGNRACRTCRNAASTQYQRRRRAQLRAPANRERECV